MINARDALLLGRVSNLPTVWANLLAGTALAGVAFGSLGAGLALILLLAYTLFYVGGMYLNDAFDANIDAEERPERPIPSGRASSGEVYAAGFGMLFGGLVLLGIAGALTGTAGRAIIGGIALCTVIIWYNADHKQNLFSPVIMGLCRLFVYLSAAAAVSTDISAAVWMGACASFLYLIGLTYVAKQENLGKVSNMWPLLCLAAPLIYGAYLASSVPIVWSFVILLLAWIGVALRFVIRRGPGDIPRAVVSLIAGIALVDAILISANGHLPLAGVAVGAFAMTLALQRWIPGT